MKNKKMISFGHIYAIEFSDGSVKVGRTKKLNQRMAEHSSFAQKAGLKIIERVNSVLIPNYEAAENHMIRLCRQLCKDSRSSEHFTGVEFAEVKKFINSFSFLSKSEVEEINFHNDAVKKHSDDLFNRGLDKNCGINPDSETYEFDRILIPTLEKLASVKRGLSQIFALHVAAHHAYGHDYDESILMLSDSMRYLQSSVDFLSLSMEGAAIELAHKDSCNKLRDMLISGLAKESEENIQSAIDYVNSVKKSDSGFVFPPLDYWKKCSEFNDGSE